MSDLRDDIQGYLSRMRALDPELYEMAPGQIPSSVDQRIATFVAAFIESELGLKEWYGGGSPLYQVTDPAEREKIYRNMFYKEHERASRAVADTVTLLLKVARLLHGDDSVKDSLEREFTEKLGVPSEEWLEHNAKYPRENQLIKKGK